MADTIPSQRLSDEALPSVTRGPITRATLALFAGASGDHNPIHIDIDYARAAGLTDVFAHGMLSAAYVGNWLASLQGPERLRSWSVRFVSITPVGVELEIAGNVVEWFERDGEKQARVKFAVATKGGQTTITGEAVIGLKPA